MGALSMPSAVLFALSIYLQHILLWQFLSQNGMRHIEM